MIQTSYEIIKAHGGKIKVNTVENEGPSYPARVNRIYNCFPGIDMRVYNSDHYWELLEKRWKIKQD